MNFVLFHMGGKMPGHVIECVCQIRRTNPSSEIFMLTDNACQLGNGVRFIDISTYNVPDIGGYYINDYFRDLWRSAVLRMFYICSFMEKNNITDVIHFDNDVMIYHDVENIMAPLSASGFSITPGDPFNYIFGFSYISNYQILQKINSSIYGLVTKGEKYLEKLVGSMPHEMRLLKYVNDHMHLMDELPVLPSDTAFSKYGYCFDPSSYGQFLGGARPEADKYIGHAIVEGTVDVVFEDHKPYVKHMGSRYPIFNLHVHNKNLAMFT